MHRLACALCLSLLSSPAWGGDDDLLRGVAPGEPFEGSGFDCDDTSCEQAARRAGLEGTLHVRRDGAVAHQVSFVVQYTEDPTVADLRDDVQRVPDAAQAAERALATLQEAATDAGWVLADTETEAPDQRVVHTLRRGSSSRLLGRYTYQVMTVDVVAVTLLEVADGPCLWPE